MTTKEFMDDAAQEIGKPNTTYISPESGTGFRLEVTDHTIMIVGSHGSHRSYTFDNQEDWEDFCEATWKTENYIPMKRSDFIEFFKALQFVYNYHHRQLEEAKRRQSNIQGEIDKQENNLNKLQDMIIGYEEVYNESKVQ